MKREILLFCRRGPIETTASAIAITIGSLGLLGWSEHTLRWARALRTLSPTYASTAAGLILCGAGLLAITRVRCRLACAISAAICLLGSIELLEHGFGLDFGVDQVLVRQPWQPGELHPGHMAASAAVCFIFIGLGLFAAGRLRKDDVGLTAAIVSAAVLSLSSVTIFGISAGFPSFDIWHSAHMGLLAAVGFFAIGIGLLAVGLRAHGRNRIGAPRWLPFFVGLGNAIATLCLWQALKQRELISTHSPSVLPEVVLGSGVLMSVLLPLALYFAQSNWRRAVELARINEGLSAEIRERRLAEERLSSSEERFRQLAASAQDAIIALNPQGKVVFWNSAAERMFGYSQAEVEERDLHDLIASPELRPSANERLHRFLATGEGEVVGTTIETAAVRKGNVRFPVELSLSAFWSGGQRHALGLVRDITARKQTEQELIRYTQDLEEARSVEDRNARELARLIEELGEARLRAEEAAHAKGEFLASMSHEIRTPLNGIIGMSGLLLDTGLDEEQTGYLQAIRHSADALLTLVNNILDFSKVHSRKLVLENIPFDLESLLDEVMELLAPQANAKGLELLVWRGEDCPLSVVGDPGRVRQVVLNLVGNAVKFTERGHVLLELASAAVGVSISVHDTGVGIAPEKLPLVFQRFTQADSSTTRKYGGTGLGLAIAKDLVELMGGRLDASSEPGEGTALRVTLPLAPAPHREPERAFPELKALIVDSHDIARFITADLCSRSGADAAEAATAGEALRILAGAVAEGAPFNLVLADSMLPDMEATQFVRSVRELPSGSGTDVVLLTAVGRPGAARNVSAGSQGLLAKPLKRKALLAVLAGGADRRRSGSLNKLTAALGRPKAQHSGRRRRVLVAEDNAINQKLALRLLEKLGGCEADVAPNGAEAFRMWGEREYDVILMDCHMPEMDGLEATRRIRSKEQVSGGHTPIIALTASAMVEDREQCLAAGMDRYLSKPFRREDLASMLEQVAASDMYQT